MLRHERAREWPLIARARRQRLALPQRNDFTPKKIKGRDKNGELDREAELDAQYSKVKLLCGD